MVKGLIRKTLNYLRIDATKNLEYDRLTNLVLKNVLKIDSNCIDVGCHKGEILELMIKIASDGKHYAFEPIPEYYQKLVEKNYTNVIIKSFALSDENGEATFNYVVSDPAYSGLKEREYKNDNPEIQKIEVHKAKLDDVVPVDYCVDFMKIDVEGGEYGVLSGAKELIKRSQPTIIFEFGLGASDYYDISAKKMYELLSDYKLSVATLKGYLGKREKLSLDAFTKMYKENSEYYFIAYSEK